MSIRNAKIVFLAKLLLTAMALVALVAVPAGQLAHSVTIGELLVYCAVGVIGVIALIILGAICSLQFSQFILRAGGTDAQWFWFPGEPKGLAALREQQREGAVVRDES